MGELPEKRLRIADVATAWGCSHQHVRNLIKRGELPAIRIGSLFRIRPDDVVAYENREKCQTDQPRPTASQSETVISTPSGGIPSGARDVFRLGQKIGQQQHAR
ncbi:helix-turn-helix domain-containing protein [Komagataeibacter xylinus]|uniref:helix-turn-helix domain-containing protein n=1 Tax=Komagataeibacter xylinus TaxID=28448 RepID=UPI00280BEC90|nr:helix-turn-helix domain-containing protein [Komagataeibacter xylinus]